jgi:hypothetical protein
MVRWLVDGLEWTWNGAVMPFLNILPRDTGKPRNTSVMIAVISAGIRISCLPSRNQKRYYLSQLSLYVFWNYVSCIQLIGPPRRGIGSSQGFCLYRITLICRVSEKYGTNGNFFIIYYLHYIVYMFTPTIYAFSRPRYHVCADFAQHIGIDSCTAVCNSGSLVLNSSATCLWVYPWRPLRNTISTLSSNVNAMFSL